MKSYQYPAAVREHSTTKRLAKLLFIALATYADDNGECFPSHTTLRRETGLSLRTIERTIKALVQTGELEVIEKGRARHFSTRYRITINPRHSDGSNRVNSRQDDDSKNNNPRHADGSTPVTKSGVTPVTESGRTTHIELPIELPKARKRAAGSEEFLQLPEELRSNEPLNAAWNKWVRHRFEIRKKLTPTTAQEQIAKLRQWGPERAIAALHHSTSNGWQGLFEPPVANQKPQPHGKRLEP